MQKYNTGQDKGSKVPPPPPEPASYLVRDPEEFGRNMLRLLEESSRAFADMLGRNSGKGPYNGVSEMAEGLSTLSALGQRWLADPVKLAEAQGELARSYFELWNASFKRIMGDEQPPVAKPEPGDNRFKDPEWSTNPYFDFWKQAYLIATKWADDLLQHTEGLDERTRHKAQFHLKQFSSALSPSNFPMTNPEVLRETFATNAKNLVSGMENFARDLAASDDVFKISQTDLSAFEVGKNLAVTPGKVVFQNEVLQLIQYEPKTERVRAVPLLIVPPWINKYYILDLTQPKSFVKYAVDQGFTVFVVSWVNPDEHLGYKTFEDYMREGILAASEAVVRETGEKKINILGYCVGGTLLAATLAYLASRGDDRYASASFLAAQVDFTRAGDLTLFIDDGQLKYLEEMMAEKGYLDGSRMATVFNLLRPRDLIWPYIVNNYMMGRKPIPFDLLFWNQDSTRLPAANHKFYLRECYYENKLARGEMVLGGVKLDMRKVKVPVFELATKEDHIAPAESVYIAAKLFGGPVELALAGSGHIAGVVNPFDPKKPKYQYWTQSSGRKNGRLPETLEEWLATAKETPGSWWPHWAEWLAAYSGDWTEPRKPGARLGAIEDAPGSYVKA